MRMFLQLMPLFLWLSSLNIVDECVFMFFSICLRVVRMSLLGSVDRWVSPSHIKANDRLKLREESPVTAGGAATILTQGLILLGVCSCACVCTCACVWERAGQKMMHRSWNLFWLFNVRHPEYSSPPFFKFFSVSDICNYLHLGSSPFLPVWWSAQSV